MFRLTLRFFLHFIVFQCFAIQLLVLQAFAQGPSFSTIGPISGPVGTLVRITGSNLSNPTSFKIGDVDAIIVYQSTSELIGMVMPGATTGIISVTTQGVTRTAANFTVASSQAPNTQQGGPLVGTGNGGMSFQGHSVAISADGTTAIVGGYGDNDYTGAAWIYRLKNGVWEQQGTKLVGTGGVGYGQQGVSVAISADGRTAMVGGRRDNSDIGAAWVFTRDLFGDWSQQGNKLVGTGYTGKPNQGSSVSLSADGNTAIVGGHGDNDVVGASWVFRRNSSGAWSQQGGKLVGTGYVGASYQGDKVAISADGNTAVVGGARDNASIGASWIFTRSDAGEWSQQGPKLIANDNVGAASQGSSVSISADGNTVLIGGNKDDNNKGAFWVFTRSETSVWTQQRSKIVGTGAVGNSEFGYAVSIGADGNTAIIGGRNDNNGIGATWMFKRDADGSWAQYGNKLSGTDIVGAASVGTSVAISANGESAIVGAYNDNRGVGAVRMLHHVTPPTITSISTPSGSVGSLVTITGTNLAPLDDFTIGGTKAVMVSNTGTSLEGMVMPGAVTGTISLTRGAITVSSETNFTVTTSQVPNTQKGDKLVGNGNSGQSYQGSSVAVSADGTTAIVGGYMDDSNAGASWIYTLKNGVWEQQGNKLVGTGAVGGSRQGYSVAISADGNTVIVGGDRDNANTGASWVFTRNAGGNWSQQGNKLVGTGFVNESGQGRSVSLSADGSTAIVGGYGDDDGVGATWVFTRNAAGEWSQQGNKLVGSGGIYAAQGTSVSLSADGTTAIVGGYYDNDYVGAAWIFARSEAGVWSQQGNKLVGTGFVGDSYQGFSVSMSVDGNTAIVGGYRDDSRKGAIWVYTRSEAGVWTQQGNKLVGTGATAVAGIGHSVSISPDGNTAMVGGALDSETVGALWVFTRSAGVWTQKGNKLLGSGISGAAGVGASVAISADGNTVIAGGPQDNSNIGAAWMFNYVPPPTITSISALSGSVGSLVTITGTNLSSPTDFTIGGTKAIVVSNTGTSLVGMVMPGATTGPVSITTSAGTVSYGTIFTVTPSQVFNGQNGNKLLGTGYVGTPNHGFSVAMSADGKTAIAGAPFDNSQFGASWIYTLNNGVWEQQGNKLLGTGSVGQAMQGYSVAISADGNTALVGGIFDDSNKGAAWVFVRNNAGVWIQQGNKLVGTGGVGNSNQGRSVALSADGNMAIVGGHRDGSLTGASWVFTRNTAGEWSQQGNKLVGTGAEGAAQQGGSVSMSADGNTALVGGSGDNSNVGAAWVFIRNAAGQWAQQGNKLVGTGNIGSATQGNSVALSADGNTALVGGSGDDNNMGAIWVFTRTNGIWAPQGNKLVGIGGSDQSRQALSVSISADGNTAVVGGYGDKNNVGAAWMFSRNALGNWTQKGDKLLGSGIYQDTRFGLSVSISAEGNSAIVGGYYDNFGIGAAWMFNYVPSPAISSFSPTSASAGTTVTLTGTNFTGAKSVAFGGTEASSFTVVSDSEIAAVVGAGTSGLITVTNTRATGTAAGFSFLSSNANLVTLIPSSGTLSPVFATETTNYTLEVPNSLTAITITPTVAQLNATVKVNGIAVNSGSSSSNIGLNVGQNTIAIEVAAQDGTTKKSYTIVVTRDKATQTILFAALANKTLGDAAFTLSATGGASGNAITFSSSNPLVATVSGNTVIMVGAGTSTITASQAGSDDFYAATDVSQTLTVNKANQAISFAALVDKTYGDAAFSLSATGGASGKAITYSSSDPSVATINGNTVTIIGAGTTTITASQLGNDDYYAATDVPQTLTVNKANQAIIFAALADKTYGDAAFSLSATGGASGKAITFSSSDPSVATINGNTVTIVGAGITTITASQLGNDDYYAATDVPQTLTVNKANQTISFAALADKTYGDAAFSLSATGGASGKAITFSSSDPSVATINGNTVTIVGAGITTITASQLGNDDYYAATDVPQTLTVNKANQAIIFAALADKTYGDAAFSLSATGGASGKAITFSSSNPSVVTISGNTVTIVGAGTTTVTASQAGNDNYDAAIAVPQMLTVNKAHQSISFAALAEKTFGDAAFSLSATGGASGKAITFSSSDPSVATINGNTVTIVGAGTTTITASQAGSDDYHAATDVSQTLIVNKANQAISFAALADKTFGDAAFTLSATGGASGKAITFSSSNHSVATINGSTVTIVGAGTITITASQAGNDNYNAAGDVVKTLTVKSAPNAKLVSLAINVDNINPAFDPTVFNYTVSVGTGIKSVTFNPAVNESASIKINGVALEGNAGAATVPLNFGNNVVVLEVTAQDGTKLNYNFVLTREAPPVSNNAPFMNSVSNQSVCMVSSAQRIDLAGITANDAGQETILSVRSSNPSFFTLLNVGQVVNGNANLMYTLANTAQGSATVTVTVKDNGGTANNGVDTFERIFTITSNALPTVSISSSTRNNNLSLGAVAVLTASGGTSYVWANAQGIIGGQNSAQLTVKPISTTTYTVTVTNASGCTITKSFTVNVLTDYKTIEAANILTPNGDGVNDNWVIENIHLYPNNEVTVFDVNGRIVFSKKGYDNSWSATVNGVPLAKGTYFYIVDFGVGNMKLRGSMTIL